MSSKENKHRFIKFLIELLVVEKSYAVDTIEDEEVIKKRRLWHAKRIQEHVSPNKMTLILSDPQLWFFINRSKFVKTIIPFGINSPNDHAHINMNVIPSINI